MLLAMQVCMPKFVQFLESDGATTAEMRAVFSNSAIEYRAGQLFLGQLSLTQLKDQTRFDWDACLTKDAGKWLGIGVSGHAGGRAGGQVGGWVGG
jgi:hypothetical protein